jgi:putative methionine-R-sulfoxide reductase with GAF domain
VQDTGKKTVGVLDVDSTDKDAFRDEDVAGLVRIAALIYN